MLLAYTISTLFVHIWETSADAILHCYCVDNEIQTVAGSGKARHATDYLHEIMDKAQQRKRKWENHEEELL